MKAKSKVAKTKAKSPAVKTKPGSALPNFSPRTFSLSSFAAMGSSSSGSPCPYQITGPADVPGLSEYFYELDASADPGTITWSVDKSTASIVFDNDDLVKVAFTNTQADWITLRADFQIDGNDTCAEKKIALVKVDVDAPDFTTPGTVAANPAGLAFFLVNPPPPPAVPTWVVTHDPGSDWAAFTYNGTKQAAESNRTIVSNGGGGGAAFSAKTKITLTSPAEKPTALQQIQVGYIQHLANSGSATYKTVPPKNRTITVPSLSTVDWLSSPSGPAGTDEWPWYDTSSRATGSGSGSWNTELPLLDSPSLPTPMIYGPEDINTAAAKYSFAIRIAARTLDTDMDAHKSYFNEGTSDWTVNYVWPVIPAVSIVTHGAAWTIPNTPSKIDVNVTPSAININAPYNRWER